MQLREVALEDRYDLAKRDVLLSGTQSLIRAMLIQKARDGAAGLSTAGYATGYRGSPLGAVDLQMQRAGTVLRQSDILFEPGLNEDLAATALWGAQQANLRGEGRVDGVFGLWYGKGPGVDRSGDVFRHANMAGSAAQGGVLVCMGDDHTGESSTVLHQSELALVDAMMPILAPAGVQEVLDYAVLGWALSRYSGTWVGLKCVKDTIEVTQVVDGDPHRIKIRAPDDFEMPQGGLNIRRQDTPREQEARLHRHKKAAAQAFARANGLDNVGFSADGARIGIVSAGKSWLDTVHALDLLGIDAERARAMGITTYKIGMVWPLDAVSLRDWAASLDLVIVVEEKRKLIEGQIKQALYGMPGAPRVVGECDAEGRSLFPVEFALEPVGIATALGQLLSQEGLADPELSAHLNWLNQARRADNVESITSRQPWFCSGCPHNTSTIVPEGAHAFAGIGCHYMALWMDRATEGATHMGAEGANWIGEAPFSKRDHVFQNMGDGTYNHSGVQAIRAALASNVNITFKILFNDAVAMTGGQRNDGGLTPQQIARELLAMGVGNVAVVYDEKEPEGGRGYPASVSVQPRAQLDAVQRGLQQIEGVSALIYVQTCAAEKRRRRKRGAFPDPDRRVFIHPDICEGCGDCGLKSNCVSVIPKDTPLGRKRQIDQSACNKDFSCVEGFCPSFVTVHGARMHKAETKRFELPDLPDPVLPTIGRTHNIVVTGIGGTGAVTIGAVIAMAAHLEGKGVGVMEMAGLAQKGGSVWINCRIANRPEDITAIRVATGEADALIGGDLVVSADAKTLGLATRGRTRAVVNTQETMTGAFLRDGAFSLPADRMKLAISARFGAEKVAFLEATRLAEICLGDAIYANMLCLGAAWQAGMVPLERDALCRAIELNGAGVAANLRAFELGRWAVVCPEAAALIPQDTGAEESLDEMIDRRAAHLRVYQDAALAGRYRAGVVAARAIDEEFGAAVAQAYHKLLAYKDEYEVARLHVETLDAALAESFEGFDDLEFHLAPPIFARKGPDGHPVKQRYGRWLLRVLRVLARMKQLRGTQFDPFGRTQERRMERALIAQYETDLAKLERGITAGTRDIALALVKLPLEIKGFGHVKSASVAEYEKRRETLWAAFEQGGAEPRQAAE